MSLIQIPNLPAVVGLDGTELFEGVQAGTSVKISLNQMIAAAWGGNPVTLPIPVSLGGTGVTTLTGYVKGSATSPFTASPTIPNTDITGLGTMSTQNANAVTITGGTAALTGASSVTVNSASAAFTVTQTGAGNAFVVEDSASDATPFVVDAAGNVGIGAAAPSSKLELRGASPQTITISHTNGTGYDTTLTATYSATKSFEILSGGFSAFSLRPTDGAAVIGARLRVDRGASVPEIWLNGASGTDQVGLKAGTAGLGAMEFYTGAAERMRIDASGNLLIGTTVGYTSTSTAGAVAIKGTGVYPATRSNGNANTAVSSAITTQQTVLSTGASASTTVGLYAAPIIENSGAGGSSASTVNGILAEPVLLSSGASARIAIQGITTSATRAVAADTSANANNFLYGGRFTAGHNEPIPITALTGTVGGAAGFATNYSGVTTALSSFLAIVNVGGTTNAKAASSTTAAAFNVLGFTVGAATSLGAATVTDGYGVKLLGPTVAATGTMTNYYALRADAPTVTGTLTNRYGIWIDDALSTNYFAGTVGVGTSTPNAASIIDAQSTTKGVRFPNMTTTEKNAIANVAGNVVFDTTLGKLCVNTGAGWQTITSA